MSALYFATHRFVYNFSKHTQPPKSTAMTKIIASQASPHSRRKASACARIGILHIYPFPAALPKPRKITPSIITRPACIQRVSLSLSLALTVKNKSGGRANPLATGLADIGLPARRCESEREERWGSSTEAPP